MSRFPSVPPELTLSEKVEIYLSKGVGRDMLLKTVAYSLRLVALYSNSKAFKDWSGEVVLNILDCRMLYNQWKHIGAFRSFIHTFTKERGQSWIVKILTAMVFLFRTFEQISGDFSYLQKNVYTHWSRQRLSWHYKFWKTMSLTCAAMLELRKILRNHSELSKEKEVCIASPVVMSPATPPPSPLLSNTSSPSATGDEIRRSKIFLARNICDMIVYYQWMSWYRPYPTLQYLCGIISALLGVLLVWEDIDKP